MKNWIQGAVNPAHKGLLHQELGVPQGQTIPPGTLQNAAHQGGKLGKQAQFAMNMKHLNSPWAGVKKSNEGTY